MQLDIIIIFTVIFGEHCNFLEIRLYLHMQIHVIMMPELVNLAKELLRGSRYSTTRSPQSVNLYKSQFQYKNYLGFD